MARTLLALGLLTVSLTLGCSSAITKPEHVKTAQVSGSLSYQGRPLASFQVILTPTDGQRPARGKTDQAGKFTVGTNQPGDGAAIGLHKVSVVYEPPESVDSAEAMPIDDPSKMPKPPVELPKKYSNPETSELTVEVPKEGLSDYKLELK